VTMAVLFEDCLPRSLSPAHSSVYWREDLIEDEAERPGTLSAPPWGDWGPTLHRSDL